MQRQLISSVPQFPVLRLRYLDATYNFEIHDDFTKTLDLNPLFLNYNLSRLIVSGASGGVSRINKVQSKADQIRALVQLVVNETLFIISGQMGSSVCQNYREVSFS